MTQFFGTTAGKSARTRLFLVTAVVPSFIVGTIVVVITAVVSLYGVRHEHVVLGGWYHRVARSYYTETQKHERPDKGCCNGRKTQLVTLAKNEQAKSQPAQWSLKSTKQV
jgi:hypothetical protein